MLTRRFLMMGLACVLAGRAAASPQGLPGVEPVIKPAGPKLPVPKKASIVKPPKKKTTRKPLALDPQFEPQQVDFYTVFIPGTIVINSRQKLLYLVEPGNKARRYGVAIGMQGLGWKGVARIKSKVEWPSWKPTPQMLKRSPAKYGKYKDGMKGGPGNPLGARAMYFFQGKNDTQIRIHGTTQPWTIGTAASNGCFRMVNEHVIDLYDRVKPGAPVIVI